MAPTSLQSRVDKKIKTALQDLGGRDGDYWEYRRQSKRQGVHGLIYYPAMMVPQMQGDILDAIFCAAPQIRNVWDPFVGAGTTLTESMVRGRNFSGFDINPLAVLTCEAKIGAFKADQLQTKVRRVVKRIIGDRRRRVEVDFPGIDKWFSEQAAIQLARIRRSICEEPSAWARKIMWVTFAETIRRTSNSRISTYKLHLRPADTLPTLLRPCDVFIDELTRSIERVRYHEQILNERGVLNSGKYMGEVDVSCQDIRSVSSTGGESRHQLMITSPPYGDNRSTVPYGQFAYLALNWIPANELPGNATLFKNTASTDTLSLGGSNLGAKEKAMVASESSERFREYFLELRKLGRKDFENKVSSFVFDFFQAVRVIIPKMAPGGYLVWTLGNRTVGGMTFPLVDICKGIQKKFGLKHVVTVRRRIPHKRLPTRNSVSRTMGTESLLVMRCPI